MELEALCKRKQWREALDLGSSGWVFGACAKATAWQHALRLQQSSVDQLQQTSLVSCCGRVSWQAAVSCVEELQAASLRPNVACLAPVNACCKLFDARG